MESLIVLEKKFMNNIENYLKKDSEKAMENIGFEVQEFQ